MWYEAKTDALPFRALQLRHQVGNVFLVSCNRGAYGGGTIQREANTLLTVGRGSVAQGGSLCLPIVVAIPKDRATLVPRRRGW